MLRGTIASFDAEDGSEAQIVEHSDGAVTFTTRVFDTVNTITMSGSDFRAFAAQIDEWRNRK